MSLRISPGTVVRREGALGSMGREKVFGIAIVFAVFDITLQAEQETAQAKSVGDDVIVKLIAPVEFEESLRKIYRQCSARGEVMSAEDTSADFRYRPGNLVVDVGLLTMS
jgi:hypothetical protein